MPILECIIFICHASPIRGACLCVSLLGSELLESVAVFDPQLFSVCTCLQSWQICDA